MGDKIATTETLLTVRCLHACHASTRAPESESDDEKMRMRIVNEKEDEIDYEDLDKVEVKDL